MVNWEFYWNAVENTADIIEIGIIGCLFHRFVKPFLPENRYTGFIGITYVITMLILKFCSYEMDGIVAYAIGVTMAFLVMYVMDQRNIEQKVFLVITWYLLEWITGGIIFLPWDILYDLLLMRPAMAKQYFLQFGLFVMVELLYIVLVIVVMVFFIRLLHKVYVYKKENLTKEEFVLMVSPSLSVIVGRWIISYFSNMYEYDSQKYIWNEHPEYIWLCSLYQILSFAAIVTVIVTFQRIKDNQRKEKEDAVLSRQMEDMKRHIDEVEKLYFDIRSLKHDMRNHVMTLEHLYGKDEESGKYIAQLKERMNEAALEIKSGNPVTDVILEQKKKEAEEKKIAFQNEFYYPESLKISAFDVGVVLSNAINNAIEAAENSENPYISISSYRKKNAYMIEIRNSTAGMRIIDKESGLPITTKKGGEHGFGLVNIRKVAQKYYGEIDIEQTGKEFILNIMLMVEM